MKKDQRVFKYLDSQESNWYNRYLRSDETTRIELMDTKHPKFKEFRGLFAVPYEVFEHLVELCLNNGWYNPEATNC